MLACLDVDYRDDRARAACLRFADWADGEPAGERAIELDAPADYQPGQFYRRELPCLLAVLAGEPALDGLVIDGYVWLDGAGERPGLGAHLWEAMGRRVFVVGVAKNPFAGGAAAEVCRGQSARPLYVTAAGVERDWAAARVAEMHGEHRLPTLLRRVDQLSRDWA